MSRTTVVAGLTLALLAATAGAQTNFTVAAGASLPTGTFGDFHDVGYHVIAAVGIRPPVAPLGFRIEGSFHEFNRQNLGSDANDRVLSLTANAEVPFGGGIIGPYAIGGVGIYNLRQPNDFDNRTEVGFNIGGGYRFQLTGFSAFVEARYTRAAENWTYIPITFGVTF